MKGFLENVFPDFPSIQKLPYKNNNHRMRILVTDKTSEYTDPYTVPKQNIHGLSLHHIC